ncbi:MAG TPA: type II toxin-antitoxin system RelE/ParE family toxin [Longimicrobium sp.]|nr:type II toxin-antitoxin system RelE/ParE family toxin [Longimicrobium sp.]
MHLIVRPEAEADIDAAFDWYEDQEPGLGAEFIRSVDAALASVERQPHAYPVIYRTARRALLRRFPYAVFYLVQNYAVEVVACMHFKRHPRRWRLRVR